MMNALKFKTLAIITLIMSLLAGAIMVLGGGPMADKMLLGIIGSIILVVHLALIIGDLVQSLYQRVLAISIWVVVATIPTHALLKSLGATESWGQDALNLALIVLFASFATAAVRSLDTKRRLAQESKLRRAGEWRAYEATLAPHTMFNLLNTVYGVLLNDKDRGLRLLMDLTEMMRYFSLNGQPNVEAETELTFMKQLRNFAIARSPDSTRIDLTVTGDLQTVIPRMTCAVLFENAIKHGQAEDGRLTIDAALTLHPEGGFDFSVENEAPEKPAPRAGMQQGLRNLRGRLEALFPGAYRLTHSTHLGRYRAFLSVGP